MFLALACAGCSSTAPTQAVGNAVTAPAKDLNLVQTPIPDILQAARQAPYALPTERSCASLQGGVKALSDVLGPDLDAPAEPKASHVERAGDAAAQALVKAAEGAVPLRGWVRKLSGAERHSRQVEAAIQAGEARRAFLRGLAAAQQC
jgi:hypothetical protein